MTSAERFYLAYATNKFRLEIELASGRELDAIAARVGVPPRTFIMEMDGGPLESDFDYRRRVLRRVGF